MQNPFKMLGDLNEMRKHAAEIQRSLEAQEHEIKDGNIKIVITGNQNVKLIEIDGQPNEQLRRAMNNAIKQSQQAAAGKLSDLSKMLNMQG